MICIKAVLRGFTTRNLAVQKQDNSGKASNNVIKFVTPKLLVVRHVSSPQGSSLHTNQSANYGLLLTNILLANILATECIDPNVVDRQLGCAALLREMGGIGGGHISR